MSLRRTHHPVRLTAEKDRALSLTHNLGRHPNRYLEVDHLAQHYSEPDQRVGPLLALLHAVKTRWHSRLNRALRSLHQNYAVHLQAVSFLSVIGGFMLVLENPAGGIECSMPTELRFGSRQNTSPEP
jgi:hypothetical protein